MLAEFIRGARFTRGFIAGTFALAVLAAGGQAEAAAFTKGPFLQSLGAAGVTVKLELSSPEKAKLEVYEAGTTSAIATVEGPDARSFHALRANGLKPGTSYDYRVIAGDGAASELGHFSTAPAAGEDKPIRFLVYGDSRSDAAAHMAVVRVMEGAKSDFLINTGDMVATGSSRRDWQTFFDIEKTLLRDRCVFAAVGNHELAHGDPEGEIAFLRYFAAADPEGKERAKLYGSFRWGSTRFFLLNAMDTWAGEDKEWLRSELDQAMDEPGLRHRIAVLHHGPFSSGPHGGNQRLAANQILGMMRDRKIDLVLAGHDHAYERGEGAGLKYIVSGGSGAPLYSRERRAQQTLAFESVHHFVEVAIDGDEVKTIARRASGSVIESCGFRGASGWSCDGAPTQPASTQPGGSASAPPPVAPVRANACGCSVPGAATGGGALAAAALLGAIALRRRRG